MWVSTRTFADDPIIKLLLSKIQKISYNKFKTNTFSFFVFFCAGKQRSFHINVANLRFEEGRKIADVKTYASGVRRCPPGYSHGRAHWGLNKMQDIAGGHTTILMNQAKRNENNDDCKRGYNEKRADFIMNRTNWWHEVVRTVAAVSGASISHLTKVNCDRQWKPRCKWQKRTPNIVTSLFRGMAPVPVTTIIINEKNNKNK